MKTVNLELPDYLWTDLKIRAAHKQTSVRHVIMAALAADSFAIREARTGGACAAAARPTSAG